MGPLDVNGPIKTIIPLFKINFKKFCLIKFH